MYIFICYHYTLGSVSLKKKKLINKCSKIKFPNNTIENTNA